MISKSAPEYTTRRTAFCCALWLYFISRVIISWIRSSAPLFADPTSLSNSDLPPFSALNNHGDNLLPFAILPSLFFLSVDFEQVFDRYPAHFHA
jgi:hypothetical protein